MKTLIFIFLFLYPFVIFPQKNIIQKDTVYKLSPILITATEATVRKTPVTFTNIQKTEIVQKNSLTDFPILLSELPSITTYSEGGNGIGYNYISLRGFDQRRISVMVNGVPQNDPEDHNVYWLDMPDLMGSTGNIQVQRGAGSTLYGPPAIGGSVNIVTNPFEQKPFIALETLFGFQEFGDKKSINVNTRKYSATINSGLIENKYMLYGRLGTLRSEGYRENSWAEMQSYFLGAVRFDETMTTRFHFFGGPIADGLVYKGLPKFYNNNLSLRRKNYSDFSLDNEEKNLIYATERRPQEIENFSQPHYELLHEWKIFPSTKIYNTFFYYTGEGFFDYDASWADTTTLRLGTKYGIPTQQNPQNTIIKGYVNNKHGGWLPRIEIEHTNGTLTLGAEFRRHRSTHWGKIEYAENLPPNYNPDYHFYEYNGGKDMISLFANENFLIEEDLTLMTNAQFVYNRYEISNEKFLGNNFSISYYFFNPRFGVNYNFSEELNTYFSIAYTSREPRLRNLYAAEDSYFGATPVFEVDTANGNTKYNFDKPLVKPEQLLNFELGTGFLTEDFQFTANIFLMEFTNELVKNGQVDIFGNPITGNAERSRHYGIELEGNISLLSSLSLKGNISYSQNTLVNYSIFENSQKIILDGNPIAGFPNLLGNLRLTYSEENILISVLGKYVGDFYTDNFKNSKHKNDAYTVFNTEILYTVQKFFQSEIILRGEIRNIFNTLYTTSGEGNAFFPAAERNYVVGAKIVL